MEINAGAWYLRGVPVDTGYLWEVCEPVSGESVAQVRMDPDTATMTADGDNADAIDVAQDAVRRFAHAALGITIIP